MNQRSALEKKIADFLSSLPIIHNADGQRALILSAGLDPHLQNLIKIGIPVAEFVPSLVATLFNYGMLDDGRYAIEAVLEATKNYIGYDRKVNEYEPLIKQFKEFCTIENTSKNRRLNLSETTEKKREFLLAFSGKKWNLQFTITILGIIIAILVPFSNPTIRQQIQEFFQPHPIPTLTPTAIPTKTPFPTPTQNHSPSHDIIVLVIDETSQFHKRLTDVIISIIQAQKLSCISGEKNYLNQANSIFEGNIDANLLHELTRHGKYVFLGKVNKSFFEHTDIQGVIDVTIILDARIISLQYGTITQFTLVDKGLGFSKKEAENIAIERMTRELELTIPDITKQM